MDVDRAGRLADPEQLGVMERTDAIEGQDVGIDGGAASAEEAAVHVVDLDRPDASRRPRTTTSTLDLRPRRRRRPMTRRPRADDDGPVTGGPCSDPASRGTAGPRPDDVPWRHGRRPSCPPGPAALVVVRARRRPAAALPRLGAARHDGAGLVVAADRAGPRAGRAGRPGRRPADPRLARDPPDGGPRRDLRGDDLRGRLHRRGRRAPRGEGRASRGATRRRCGTRRGPRSATPRRGATRSATAAAATQRSTRPRVSPRSCA